jgi:hypothetical protein
MILFLQLICCRLRWRLWGTTVQDDDKWSEMLAALLKKGTYDVLKNFKVAVPCDDGGSQVLHLGVWLHKQREERLKGTLCPDKEALLQVSSAL